MDRSTGGAIARGILVGGSLGVIAALLDILPGLFRGLGIGMIAGFFAGVTMLFLRSKK